jgi:DNA-binding response OmpR family regulator
MLQGLAAGADDFLTKPFNPEILLARARAILRRSQRSNGSNGYHGPNGNNGNNGQYAAGGAGAFTYNDGYLSIDIERHEVLVHAKRVKLTPIEFRLLVYLARNAGKLLTFDKILANVWGDQYQGSMDYVHVYISHLRRKIEPNAANSRYILTVHGEGYIFENRELTYKP